MSSIIARFTFLLGAAVLLQVLVLNPAFAQPESSSQGAQSTQKNEGTEVPANEVTPQDNQAKPAFDPNRNPYDEDDQTDTKALPGSTSLLRPLTISLFYSFGRQRTLDRGKEANFDAYWNYAEIQANYHLGNLGETGAEHTRLEAILSIGGNIHGQYQGSDGPDANMDSGNRRFNSVYRNIRLRFGLAVRDIARSPDRPARYEAELFGSIGLDYERGRVGHNDPFAYRSKQTAVTLGLRGTFSLLFPFYGLGSDSFATQINGERTTVPNGFAPRIQIAAEYYNGVSVSRRTTVTRLGGVDRQRPISFFSTLRFHVWRWANETPNTDQEWLWETDLVLLGQLEGAKRYGYAQVRNDHFTLRYGPGIGVHIAGNRRFFVQFEALVLQENRGTDRLIGQGSITIGWQF